MNSSLSSLWPRTAQRVRNGLRAISQLGLAALFIPWTSAVLAEVPRVVTDIPATHSLVSLVMGDLGEPTLLLQGSASPHDYALKPSEAKVLSNADAVIWISADLTPWLPRAINSLTSRVMSIELLTDPETLTLPFRASHEFEAHASEDEHAHETHEHGNVDPHAWLDPVNARTWLMQIATHLGNLDGDNRTTYLANATAADARIRNLTTVLDERLIPVREKPFMVFHDSYHYFETRFNLHAIGSISLGDGSSPGIKRIRNQREALTNYGNACVFSEPQFSLRLIRTVTENMNVRIGQLDPVGALLEPGPDLYAQLLTSLAESFLDCLSSD